MYCYAFSVEFCGHFGERCSYKSMFAMTVSQNLPQLPPGVDGQDPRVMRHVAGMLLQAGQLAGARAIASAQTGLTGIHESAKHLWEKVKRTKALLYQLRT